MTYALLLGGLLVAWVLNTPRVARRRPVPVTLKIGFWDYP